MQIFNKSATNAQRAIASAAPTNTHLIDLLVGGSYEHRLPRKRVTSYNHKSLGSTKETWKSSKARIAYRGDIPQITLRS
jgi:hypothetical protein